MVMVSSIFVIFFLGNCLKTSLCIILELEMNDTSVEKKKM